MSLLGFCCFEVPKLYCNRFKMILLTQEMYFKKIRSTKKYFFMSKNYFEKIFWKKYFWKNIFGKWENEKLENRFVDFSKIEFFDFFKNWNFRFFSKFKISKIFFDTKKLLFFRSFFLKFIYPLHRIVWIEKKHDP